MVSWTGRENAACTDALFRNCVLENASIKIAQFLLYRLIYINSRPQSPWLVDKLTCAFFEPITD